jgi:hypothetical protein
MQLNDTIRRAMMSRATAVEASRIASAGMRKAASKVAALRAAFAQLRDARRRARAFNRALPDTEAAELAPIKVPLAEVSEDRILRAMRAVEELEVALKPIARGRGVPRRG